MSKITEISKNGNGSPNPMTVWAVHRNVTVTSQIVTQFTQGDELGSELLKIWDPKFAALQFGLINSEKKSGTMKIRLNDEYIPFLKEAEKALKKSEEGMSDEEALAYTPFGMGKYASESPATMIQKGMKKELQSQYNFFKENAERWPRNKLKMAGIQKAIQLYKEGKLKKGSGSMILFSKPLHINPYKKSGDRYFVSSARISYMPGLQSPFVFEVQEGWAKGEKKGDSPLLLPVSGTLQVQKVAVALQKNEFLNMIEKIKNTVTFIENARRSAVIEAALAQEKVQFDIRTQKKSENVQNNTQNSVQNVRDVRTDSAKETEKGEEDYLDLI